MNFLAHLYLAEPRGTATPPELVGSLMPDLVRGPLPRDLPAAVAGQVDRHRRIDRATDTHPAFLEAASLFRPDLGRLAGIATDVALDAALCRAWPGLHPMTLEAAIDAYHAGLFAGRGVMPPRMRQAVRRMLRQGWLRRYATDDGLRATFDQMSRHFSARLRRPVDLVPAAKIAAAGADDLDRLLVPLLDALRRPSVLRG